jgi:hypothetical protein
LAAGLAISRPRASRLVQWPEEDPVKELYRLATDCP